MIVIVGAELCALLAQHFHMRPEQHQGERVQHHKTLCVLSLAIRLHDLAVYHDPRGLQHQRPCLEVQSIDAGSS